MTERDRRHGGDRSEGGSFWDDDWLDDDWREQTRPNLTPVRGGALADPGVRGWDRDSGREQDRGREQDAGQQRAGWQRQPGWAQEPSWRGDTGRHAAVEPDDDDPRTGAIPSSGSSAVGARRWDRPGGTTPQYSPRPAAARRPDAVASLFALLAGISAGVSVLLYWVNGSSVTGASLVRDGIRAGGRDISRVFDLGYWEPLAVVFGGGLLFLLGLLLLLPMRTHRVLGVLALLTSLVAAAGVLAPLAQDGWNAGRYDDGMWFACAVGGLGLIAAFKAMLTGPRFGSAPYRE